MSNEIVLIDLSSICHPIYHMSQSEPDPNHTSQQTVARVRNIANGKPHVAVCCDSGKSFRHELSPAYKANRPAAEAPLHHQIKLACEALKADGFPVWSVRGFEADDLIASGVEQAVAAGRDALIVSADKDLLQLVGPRVKAMSLRDGSILDEAAVVAKFGVRPDQMRDYLTLVGDASDNVKGVKGIGPKKAADLLAKFDTLDKAYDAINACDDSEGKTPTGLQQAVEASLRDFRIDALAVTRSLIALRSDVPLAFAEVDVERVPQSAAEFLAFDPEGDTMEANSSQPTVEPVISPEGRNGVEAAKEKVIDLPGNGASAPSASRLNQQLTVREAEILPAPQQWERGLDPRSMTDARILAKDMHDSRMFSAYGTPQAVLSTVMLGRELGLPAMASLRGVDIVEGRHSLKAQTMVGVVLKSGLADYFRPVSISATSVTYETQRKGDKPFQLTHTIEMAQTANLVKPNSNWIKVPTDMLCARASARLARLIYPDVVGGLYTPDELLELKAVA